MYRVICEGLSDDPCDWSATYRKRRDAETSGTSHANEEGHAFSHIEYEDVPTAGHVCAACGETFADYGDLIEHYQDKARGPVDERHWPHYPLNPGDVPALRETLYGVPVTYEGTPVGTNPAPREGAAGE